MSAILAANNRRQGLSGPSPGKPERQQEAHRGFELDRRRQCFQALDVDRADGHGLMLAFLMGEDYSGEDEPERQQDCFEGVRERRQLDASIIEGSEKPCVVKRGDGLAEGIRREFFEEAKIERREGARRVDPRQDRASGRYGFLQILGVNLGVVLQVLFDGESNAIKHLAQQRRLDMLPVSYESLRGRFEGPIAVVQRACDEEGTLHGVGRPHLDTALADAHTALAGRVHEPVLDPSGQARDGQIHTLTRTRVDKLACSCSVPKAEIARRHASIIGRNHLQVNVIKAQARMFIRPLRSGEEKWHNRGKRNTGTSSPSLATVEEAPA